MDDTTKDAEDSNIPGFSVIDSLPSTSTPETEKSDVKIIDDNAAAANGELSALSVSSIEEKLFVIADGSEENDVKADKDDTIVLDTSGGRDDKDLNQSTLIITTEDLLDSTVFDDSITISKAVEVEEPKKPIAVASVVEENTKVVKPVPKLGDNNYIWVSNIRRQVKAADLKKFFSQVGKVLTAKILTNGRSYFGYISMNSAELAAKCVTQLHNTPFDGQKIVVSKDRPDLRETKPTPTVDPKKKKIQKTEPKKSEPTADQNENGKVPKAKTTPAEDKKVTEDHSKCDAIIADLKKSLDRAKAETSRHKSKVMEFQRRHEGMRKKCDTLERELKDTQYKLRNERRRLNQDREQFEKTKKLEQIRFDADKAVVNKELDEVKKLREHLKEKIDELKAQSKKVVKRRSRSPVPRGRNIRGRSPALRNNLGNAFRSEERTEKRRKRDVSRGRTPPPPPKLNDIAGKKRGERGQEASASTRSYYGDGEKRPLSLAQEYEFRHKPCFGLPQDELRGVWPSPFSKDPRRTGSGPSSSQSYPPEVRYGGGYQFPTPSESAPPRSYYQVFAKSYAPY